MDFLANLADTFGVAESPPASSEAEGDVEDQDIPELYRPLYQATWALTRREIDEDDWLELWEAVGDTLLSLVEKIEEQVRQLIRGLPPARGPATREQVFAAGAELRRGLKLAVEALDRMGEFVDDGDAEHLSRGWVDLLEASDVVQRASIDFQALRLRIQTYLKNRPPPPPPEPNSEPDKALPGRP